MAKLAQTEMRRLRKFVEVEKYSKKPFEIIDLLNSENPRISRKFYRDKILTPRHAVTDFKHSCIFRQP